MKAIVFADYENTGLELRVEITPTDDERDPKVWFSITDSSKPYDAGERLIGITKSNLNELIAYLSK